MLSVMLEPAATVFAVAPFTGLRQSELQGLRWKDYQDGEIRVSRAISEGQNQKLRFFASQPPVPPRLSCDSRIESLAHFGAFDLVPSQIESFRENRSSIFCIIFSAH
jgi:hypothetical protein